MEANRRTMDPDFAPELDHSEFDDDTEKQAQDLYDPELESEDLEDESNDSPEDVNDELEEDENETEAAALTEMCVAMGLPPTEIKEPVVMNVNRPFMFEIAEEYSNTILFTGIINNIEE